MGFKHVILESDPQEVLNLLHSILPLILHLALLIYWKIAKAYEERRLADLPTMLLSKKTCSSFIEMHMFLFNLLRLLIRKGGPPLDVWS